MCTQGCGKVLTGPYSPVDIVHSLVMQWGGLCSSCYLCVGHCASFHYATQSHTFTATGSKLLQMLSVHTYIHKVGIKTPHSGQTQLHREQETEQTERNMKTGRDRQTLSKTRPKWEYQSCCLYRLIIISTHHPQINSSNNKSYAFKININRLSGTCILKKHFSFC